MGKAKKAHRKKVQARNQKVKAEQRQFEKAYAHGMELLRQMREEPKPYQPGNFVPLTGSGS